MAKSSKPKSSLQALNDFLIIEEEPIELTVESVSGLTKDVVGAIKEQRIILPDIAKNFADKFPFRGYVVSKGKDCTCDEVQVGSRVMFARLGGQRWVDCDKQYITIREKDLHAVLT